MSDMVSITLQNSSGDLDHPMDRTRGVAMRGSSLVRLGKLGPDLACLQGLNKYNKTHCRCQYSSHGINPVRDPRP